MLKIVAMLTVKNFEAFEAFEHQAASIMADYNGSIVSAFETVRNADSSGEEIHILEFACIDDFDRYKQDPRLEELSDLRERAISATHVKTVLSEKHYTSNDVESRE